MKRYNDFKAFSKDQAYWERNQLVAALSKIFPAWMELHPRSDKTWDKEWRHIVFIVIPSTHLVPAGMKYYFGPTTKADMQLSWHIHDSEVEYFGHLKLDRIANSWDGHDSNEKYRRLADLQVKKWYQFWKKI